jgi:2-hydroxychromene-2-carboxylate isomerase
MSTAVPFLYDYASPWSYLASKIVDRALPGVELDYRPIYLRGLESFKSGMPYVGAKLRYQGLDLLRCAAHHEVTIRIPPVFPVNGLYALRGDLVAREMGAWEAYFPAVFDATWRDSRNVSDKNVVVELAGELGLDTDAFRERFASDDIKSQLRERTDAAIARGVFGVPAFFVGDELFWGHDRLDYVRRAVEARG